MSFSSIINPSKWLKTGSKLVLVLGLLASIFLSAALPVVAETGIPTFSIISVVKDATVTIQTSNFPADETFTVLMGPIGTRGINGIKVATTKTGTGGTIEATYDIPEALKGTEMISIRLESESGYYSYNWFFNGEEPAAEAAAEEVDTEVKYTGIPTFSIVEVAAGVSVKISTDNFPADQEFTVRMGQYGTKGVDGVEVGKTKSEKGGTLEATYKIPEELIGNDRIAIRMDGADGTYYSYNWFYNANWPVEEAAAPAAEATPTETPAEQVTEYNGVPVFSIVKVISGSSVTILPENLPADTAFTVLMGEYGTNGVDGTEAGKLETGKDAPVEKTYSISADLADAEMIAIRLVSESGYYAYNWFFNANAPVAESEYSGVPTFTIKSVVKNKTVTILAENFPPDVEFTVLMGPMHTKAIDGKEVDKVKSGKDGAMELTFDIPADFADNTAIAIRFDSADGVYSSYNWFYNN